MERDVIETFVLTTKVDNSSYRTSDSIRRVELGRKSSHKPTLFNKILGQINIIVDLFNSKRIENSIYSSFYTEALKWHSEVKFDVVLVSGGPFVLFEIGYLLKQQFGIKWVADYRDLWSQSSFDLHRVRLISNYYKSWIKEHEKKLLSNVDLIITVSDELKDVIKKYINNKSPIMVIQNGFEDVEYDPAILNGESNSNDFKILYTGKLYYLQEPSLTLEVLNRIVTERNVIVHFIGSGISLSKQKKFKRTYNRLSFDFIPYMSKSDLRQYEINCDAFITFKYGDLKGIPSSKLYNYLPYKKPILFYPSDNDIIEEILMETKRKINISTNNFSEAVSNFINDTAYRSIVLDQIRKTPIIKYSRKFQMELLSNELKKAFTKRMEA